jgi:predicted ATP-grasp superfamily ATP-dependent carboligase
MDFQKHPVLVVAGDTVIGLNVIRSLGRCGVPVYCAYTRRDALGPQSVYCGGSFRIPTERDAAISAVREHLRRWKITHLIAIAENHISLMNSCREELEKECTLLFPRQEVFERAIRKDLTLACAGRAGIPVPETLYPQSRAEIAECRQLQFPVILKMAFHQFPPGTVIVFQHKYLRVDTYDQLERVLGALPEGQYPMIQEYIPGAGVGMSMLIRGGEVMLAFQHRRIREFPPRGGIGVVCEAIRLDPGLLEQSHRLLVEMGWDGVAMVEFRVDACTGRYALMEVNGRFWGSLPTAIHAGAAFPFWLYRTSFPDAPKPDCRYRVGLVARSLAGDTKWLLASVRKNVSTAPRAVTAYLAAFRPSTRYFIWAWDDPKPGIRNFTSRFQRR